MDCIVHGVEKNRTLSLSLQPPQQASSDSLSRTTSPLSHQYPLQSFHAIPSAIDTSKCHSKRNFLWEENPSDWIPSVLSFILYPCIGLHLVFVVACGVFVVACRLLAVACGIQFPNQGLNLGPLHWERGVLATRPPGKSPFGTLNIQTSQLLKLLLWDCYHVTSLVHLVSSLSSLAGESGASLICPCYTECLYPLPKFTC